MFRRRHSLPNDLENRYLAADVPMTLEQRRNFDALLDSVTSWAAMREVSFPGDVLEQMEAAACVLAVNETRETLA